MKLEGGLVRNIDFQVVQIGVHEKTRRKFIDFETAATCEDLRRLAETSDLMLQHVSPGYLFIFFCSFAAFFRETSFFFL